GNDVLSGGGGSDQLFGGSGNDTLIPGAGNGVADFIDGGPDYDTVDYRDASGGLTVSLVNGTVGGAAVGDTFAGVENVVGSRFADTLQPSTTQFAYAAGGAGYDIIFASTANYDRIRGDAGIDTLIGDNTSDDDFWLQYDQGMDYVRDYRSGGEDHVFISRSEFNLSTPAGNFINATDFAAGIPAGVPAFGINGRLVYDFLTNILWADRDGSGTQFETVAIAVFGVGSAEPTAADIFVF
ncbi:MAG: hypothetical protein SF069_00525, partial [Phycisphaerae bacterium]|nr:hypothetical protein [Phycisphaerae bacterium]